MFQMHMQPFGCVHLLCGELQQLHLQPLLLLLHLANRTNHRLLCLDCTLLCRRKCCRQLPLPLLGRRRRRRRCRPPVRTLCHRCLPRHPLRRLPLLAGMQLPVAAAHPLTLR